MMVYMTTSDERSTSMNVAVVVSVSTDSGLIRFASTVHLSFSPQNLFPFVQLQETCRSRMSVSWQQVTGIEEVAS
jgi:hypothetical protein